MALAFYNNPKNIDDFLDILQTNCENDIKNMLKLSKTSNKSSNKSDDKTDDKNYDKTNEIIDTPNFCEYKLIYKNNYNVQQLKYFAKIYKLKLSGNKKELMFRLFYYLKYSFYVVKIQKVFRGSLFRKYLSYHGPALFKREICNNNTDFFTMDDIKTLCYTQFFSYKDIDNFIYGFDIISLYNLIKKSEKVPENPYNRNAIPQSVILDIKKMIKLSNILKIEIDINIKNSLNDISKEKLLDFRIIELFQNIDLLGNYSNVAWFQSLSRQQLIRFVMELKDIWCYRAQLSNETKCMICPPMGEPFGSLHFNYYIILNISLNVIKSNILEVLEKLVNTGVDRDSKSLGAYYVLGALTLVNSDAANSLPWLYQSFNTISV
jgi:hypothetical protein